jgi:hypothetical protein
MRRTYLYAYGRNKSKLIKVFANKKPSIETQGRSGTWVLNEWVKGKWVMPCYPEITIPILNTMLYVGELKDQPRG